MMVVIIILGVISSIAYPMLFMNQKITTQQIKESAKRNDIRSIESFLKDDLRNCKNVVESGPPETYEYKINLNSTEEILYKRLQDDQGRFYISRQRGTEVIDFKDIVDIDLEKEPRNNNLYNAQITSTDDKGDPYLHELKIARWEWEVKKKGGNILGPYEDMFLLGSAFSVTAGNISGNGAAILIRADISKEDLNSNPTIGVSDIYIEGNLGTNSTNDSIGGSIVFGNQENPGEIIIDGNVNLSGGAIIYGDNIYISGDVNLSGGAKIVANNIFILKDLDIGGGTEIIGNVYLLGEYTSKGNPPIPNFADGDVLFPGVPAITIPNARTKDWYIAEGYLENGILESKNKIVSIGDYDFRHSYWPITGPYDDVVVVSLNGNIVIDLKNSNTLSGVFFAPKGSISFKNIDYNEASDFSFEGLAIAKNGVYFGGDSGGHINSIKFKSAEDYTGESKIFENSSKYPFYVN